MDLNGLTANYVPEAEVSNSAGGECDTELYTKQFEDVDEVPSWAQLALLSLPRPARRSENKCGITDYYTLAQLQGDTIEYVTADRVACRRECANPPSPDDLPPTPLPAHPEISSSRGGDNYSAQQLLNYRQLAAQMDRNMYACAQTDIAEDDVEMPRM